MTSGNSLKLRYDGNMEQTLAPIKSLSKSSEVFTVLRQAILSGSLKPGDALREAHLARQLQVSQVPIREALLKLEHLGLVVRVQDRGTTVTKLSRQEMYELMEVRAHLEDMAFRLAAQHVTKAVERDLKRCIQRMEDAIAANDYYELSDADLEFHRMVWKLSENKVLERMLDRLCVSIYAFVSIQRHAARESLSESVSHHFDLLKALLKRKPELISAAVHEHLDPDKAVPANID